jgi:transposase
MSKLNAEQKEFFKMDLNLGISNTELARRFGVSEGTIRYHKKKKLLKKEDGRKTRHSEVSCFSTLIENWISENQSTENPKRDTILSLYRLLQDFHDFNLSYDALRRFIRKHYPEVIDKPYHLRIETPPGKLSQVDWKESVSVQFERPGNWVVMNFLIVLLCFSRRPAIIARLKKDQQSFLNAHYAALQKLGGVTEYIRPDCMKTAVKLWKGRQSEMNTDYAEFLDNVSAQGFPARPRMATDKGKVEKKIQDIFRTIDFRRIVFRNMEHLQDFIDHKIEQFCTRTTCPATGTTISEAYDYERKFLNTALQDIPQIPVDTMTTPVQTGNLVWFRGNYYQIPAGHAGKSVRCINTGTHIEIYHAGVLLEQFNYEPEVLGMIRMSRNAAETTTRPISDLVQGWWLEVAERQMEYYHDIIGAGK